METAMKLAVESYSKLSGRTSKEIMEDCLSGNQTVLDSVMMLMFSTSTVK